jgi:transposase-like protein
LTGLELRHLQLLLELREQTERLTREYDAQLEDFVLECRDSGASARSMAKELGVSPATIQTWTTNARRRRDSSA